MPQGAVVDGYRLGAWVAWQRWRHADGTLDAERDQRLDALPGWRWDPHADRWEQGFNRLVEYVESNGHARVPQPYIVDGYRLGKWVAWQRHKNSDGTLDPVRRERLAALDGWIRNRPARG